MPTREPSLSEIKTELQSVLNSRVFRQCRGLSKLLRYLCVNALVDEPDQITEYSLAVDVLGKTPDFKDGKNASVRVEVHRLRKRLTQFYEEEGASHRLQIVIPTGNYAPKFVFREDAVDRDIADDPQSQAVGNSVSGSEESEQPASRSAEANPQPLNSTSPVEAADFSAVGAVDSDPIRGARRELVREHLERLLNSAAFKNCKRYGAVLSYVVDKRLDGETSQLRERAIGAAIFKCSPDYDTSANHVVRSALAEVRKRLARYYQETGDDAEVRIELVPGSYVPQFRFAPEQPVTASVAAEETAEPPVSGHLPLGLTSRTWFRRGVIAAAGLAILTMAAFFRASASDPLQPFWDPVLSSPGNVLLCVGDRGNGQPQLGNENQTPTLWDFHHLLNQTMLISDAVALSRFTGFLGAKGRSYRIASHAEVTFSELQQGPIVLLGLSNNHWTQRMIAKLRYTVETSGAGTHYVRDRQNPSRTDWATDFSKPYLELTKDYALVFRITDPETERMVVAAAGLSAFGTLAAAKLLTDPREIRKLESIAPRNWKGKNLEAVISTDVIKGQSGHPTVVAAEFW